MRSGQTDLSIRAGRWLVGILALLWLASCAGSPAAPAWGADELRVLHSLSLDALKPLPPDPSNAVADDPVAAALGERIYFDTRPRVAAKRSLRST